MQDSSYLNVFMSRVEGSVDPDQLGLRLEASWSGTTLFFRSCHGVVNKPLALYTGVLSLIPGCSGLSDETLSHGSISSSVLLKPLLHYKTLREPHNPENHPNILSFQWWGISFVVCSPHLLIIWTWRRHYCKQYGPRCDQGSYCFLLWKNQVWGALIYAAVIKSRLKFWYKIIVAGSEFTLN